MAKHEPTVDRIFHALGDPTRCALVEELSRGPSSATRLAQPFHISLAAVVQHLQILEQAGLVRTDKPGRVRTCTIDPAGLQAAAQWIAERRTIWEQRLDRLADLLTETDGDSDEMPEAEWLG